MSECKDLMVVEQPAPTVLTQLNQFDNVGDPIVIDDGDTVYEVLENFGYMEWSEEVNGYVRHTPFVVQINGVWLVESKGDYNYRTKSGDIIRVERLAAGGKKGGSKGLGIIVAIVAIVAAPFTGGQSLWLLVASAALVMGGMAGLPKQAAANQRADGASSTYSLSGQTNQARLMGAVPKLYGRMRFYPDLASQPYTEFEGNDQFLYELFCLTCGEMDIEQIFIDETPITNFNEVQTEIIKPFGTVTLFPDNVVSSVAVDSIQLQNNVISGPYVIGLPGINTSRLGFDFTFPGGCYRVDNNGNTTTYGVKLKVWGQRVNDAGGRIGDVVELANGEIQYATMTPQRFSHYVDVNLLGGRWAVWATREGADNTSDNKIQNNIVWTGAKAYLKPEPGRNYGNVTLLAVKMKSSEVLNTNTARKFSVLGTGKTPRWNQYSGFSQPVANSSIAWAAADILWNNDYGRGMSAERIHLQQLARLDEIWTARGDTFNGIFDSTDSLWASLTKALRAGRALPMYYAGKVEFIRDEPQYLPVQMFSPKNIVAGSFSVDHNWPTRSTPDYVIVQYFDKDIWATKEVDCFLPNSPKKKSATVELFGVTNREQAWREGIFIVAGNRLRRRTVRFSIEMEGQVARYNDLIQVSHDVADWGYSGVVLDFDPVSGRVVTSEPLPFISNTCVIAFRKPDGSPDGPYSCKADPNNPDPDAYGGIVGGTLAQRQAIVISDGVHTDHTMYQFGPTNKAGLKCLVKKVTPRGGDLYNIEALGYVQEIHFAENGGVMPFPESPSNLVKPPVGPVVDRITVMDTATPGSQAVQITPAIGAQYYEYQYRLGGSPWAQLLGATQLTAITVQLPRGQASVRARGVGTTVAGPWAQWDGEIRGTTLGLPGLKSLRTTPQLFSIDIDWEFLDDTVIIADFTTIIVSSSPIPGPGNSQIMGQYPYPTTHANWKVLEPGVQLYFFGAVTDKAGRQGPFFQDMVAVPGQGVTDPAALLAMLNEQIGQSQLTQALREEIGSLIAGQEGLQTYVQQITEQMTTDREATVRYIQQLEAQVDANNNATVQMIQSVQANIDGALSSMITMRTQVRSDGKLITAGIGIGVVPDFNDPTQHNSEIILQAGRIAFTTSQLDDPLVTPLVVQGNAVYMHGAFIADLTVGYAQIGTAAVGSAKIQDLSVETIKVAGEAITIPRYTDNGGPTYPSGGTVKLLELIFTTDSYSGALMTFASSFGSSGEQRYSYWMVLDGTTLCRSDAYWSDSSVGLTAGRYIPAGTHTLQIFCTGEPGVMFYYSNLVMQAAKR